MSSLNKISVAVHKVKSEYNCEPPFNAHEGYPEYPFAIISNVSNSAYHGVRECLRLLELDSQNFGTPQWNPLRDVVNPGNQVVIKPNFVLSRHVKGGDFFSIITHPSVIRAVVDYVYIALKGEGRIIIADAPQMDCNFDELLQSTQLRSIQELYRDEKNFEIMILDLRNFWLNVRPGDTAAYSERRFDLPGDPAGSLHIQLNDVSAFHAVANWQSFYGADYDRNETQRFHNGQVHEYVVSKTILSSDVLISVPKLKVHKKVGTTLNAKGLVGITTNKNCLIHYTLGTPDEGGDQFPSATLSLKDRILVKSQRFLYDLLLAKKNPFFDKLYHAIAKTYKTLIQPTRFSMSHEKRILDAGNWSGNDSAWRMVVDLMRILYFADNRGIIRDTPQRRTFSVIDGIIGGENDGPLAPDAVESGLIICGSNLLAVDAVASRIMGMDIQKIKWLEFLMDTGLYDMKDPCEIRIASDFPEFSTMFSHRQSLLGFAPHPGWRNYLEMK